MKKKRRKQIKKKASRNALATREPKKRFGKKQKKKLIIISFILLVLFVSISFVVKYLQNQKLAAEEEARKGKIIEKRADKKEFDDDGNEIIEHTDTEVHVLNVGDASCVLIKKGHKETLVDIGSKNAIKYLSKHIDGNLEHLITTNDLKNATGGIDTLLENFEVENYYYNAKAPNARINAQRVNEQTIDMGENLSINIGRAISEKDSVLVTVKDADKIIMLAGESSERTAVAADGVYAYVVSGKPNTDNLPISTIRAIYPQLVIASTKDKLSTDFVSNINKVGSQLYATYKSKNIMLTITTDEVQSSVNENDQIRYEEEPEIDETESE